MFVDFGGIEDPNSLTAQRCIDQIQQKDKQKNGGALKREPAVQRFYSYLFTAIHNACSEDSGVFVKDTSTSGYIRNPNGKVSTQNPPNERQHENLSLPSYHEQEVSSSPQNQFSCRSSQLIDPDYGVIPPIDMFSIQMSGCLGWPSYIRPSVHGRTSKVSSDCI